MRYSCKQEHHRHTCNKLKKDKRQCKPFAVWQPVLAETLAQGMRHLAVPKCPVGNGTHKKPHKNGRLHVVRKVAEKPAYALGTQKRAHRKLRKSCRKYPRQQHQQNLQCAQKQCASYLNMP